MVVGVDAESDASTDFVDSHGGRVITLMSTTQDLLDEAKAANPKRAEEIYKQILAGQSNEMQWDRVLLSSAASASNASSSSADQTLRDQERAMISLAELYRDQR